MKNHFFILILTTVFLSSCAMRPNSIPNPNTNTNAGGQDLVLDKKWKLTELDGKMVANLINGKEPFILFQKSDNRYNASGGCNGMGGSFTLSSDGKIKFSQGMSTLMACQNMEIEMGLSKVLQNATNYSLNGDHLILSDSLHKVLAKFKYNKEANQSINLNGTWEVDYIANLNKPFKETFLTRVPTITFNVKDLKASGNGGCNTFNTTIKLNGNTIQFGDVMSTKMACEGDGENTFFKALKTINTYSTHENTLTLIMGDIAVMRLIKK